MENILYVVDKCVEMNFPMLYPDMLDLMIEMVKDKAPYKLCVDAHLHKSITGHLFQSKFSRYIAGKDLCITFSKIGVRANSNVVFKVQHVVTLLHDMVQMILWMEHLLVLA